MVELNGMKKVVIASAVRTPIGSFKVGKAGADLSWSRQVQEYKE